MNDKLSFYKEQNHPRRAVCFLISKNKKVTAKSFFDGLVGRKESIGRGFKSSFDAWIDGLPNKPHRYHGWDKSEFKGRYVKCFVFKKKDHRLYGFLCNPNVSDPRYQLCVLVIHASKNQHKSDETILKQVEEYRIAFEKEEFDI
jgi:hypothetical protein